MARNKISLPGLLVLGLLACSSFLAGCHKSDSTAGAGNSSQSVVTLKGAAQ